MAVTGIIVKTVILHIFPCIHVVLMPHFNSAHRSSSASHSCENYFCGFLENSKGPVSEISLVVKCATLVGHLCLDTIVIQKFSIF